MRLEVYGFKCFGFKRVWVNPDQWDRLTSVGSMNCARGLNEEEISEGHGDIHDEDFGTL